MARGESPYGDGLYSSPRQRSSPLRRDSPARSPAQHDLDKIFINLNLQDHEHAKVYYHQKCTFQDSLDARQRAKAQTDELRLRESQAIRDAVREEAEATLQAHHKAQEDERRRQVEEQRRKEEEEARRKAEAERQAREAEQRRVREQSEREEAAKRAESERLRQEEERRKQAAEDEKRRSEQRQREEADRAIRDAEVEAARRQQEEQAEKAKAAATPVAVAQPLTLTTTARSQAPSVDVETRHKEYLVIHKQLKTFRVEFWEQCKSDKEFKSKVGDMRRNIRKSTGQLRVDGPQENREATKKITKIISDSLQDSSTPKVPVNDYLPSHARLPADNAPTIPSLTIYLLSILAKAVIAVSIGGCVDNPRSAEAPGVLVAVVFGQSAGLQFPHPSNPAHSSSLVSILLAKFHASAPQLFGITAPERPSTAQQKLRLGWRREPDGTGNKGFIPEQAHYDRLIGLGALWAAIALRNFSKSRVSNPIPPIEFWESLALLINTPASELQVGQLILMKNMLENSGDRIVQFWGATGVALLKEALVGTQRKLRDVGGEVANHQAAKALALVPEVWAKDKCFHLE